MQVDNLKITHFKGAFFSPEQLYFVGKSLDSAEEKSVGKFWKKLLLFYCDSYVLRNGVLEIYHLKITHFKGAVFCLTQVHFVGKLHDSAEERLNRWRVLKICISFAATLML